MFLIAHRGLCDGPNPARENHPDEITRTLERGFEAEIDVRLIGRTLWLGHDEPQHLVPLSFLDNPKLWLHAKDLETLNYLLAASLNTFFHDTDEATLTASGWIWTYPGKPLYHMSICVQPEWDADWRDKVAGMPCMGFCSKHVAEIEEILVRERRLA